jgi:cell division protein FtsQ
MWVMGARRIVKKTSAKKVSVKKASQPRVSFVQRWLTRRVLGATILLGTLGSLTGFTLWQLAQPDTLPIQQVKVNGEFVYLDKKDLYQAVAGLANAGFFNVDVRAVKEAAEAMPWVHSASVRRIWPDTLRIDIHEQIPLARWQAGGIVNRHGEVVAVTEMKALSDFPVFSGPEGTARILAKRYQLLSLPLAELKLNIAALSLSKRRAWKVSLNNGINLLLGRAVRETQLTRFVSAYNNVLSKNVEKIKSVDLRYTNGFAVSWQAMSS